MHAEEFVEIFCEKLELLRPHSFIASRDGYRILQRGGLNCLKYVIESRILEVSKIMMSYMQFYKYIHIHKHYKIFKGVIAYASSLGFFVQTLQQHAQHHRGYLGECTEEQVHLNAPRPLCYADRF